MPRRSRKKIVNTSPVIPEEDLSSMTPSRRRLHERLAEYEPPNDPLPEGVTEEEFWTPEPYKPTDWSNPLIAEKYEHFELPAECPRFRVLHHARAEWQTEKQYAADRYSTESYYFGLSISLWIAQWAATYVGLHNSCPLKACRRAKECVSRRAEDDWTVFPGPWLPPCCNNHERTELVRYMVLIKLEQEEEIQRERGGDTNANADKAPPHRFASQTTSPPVRGRGTSSSNAAAPQDLGSSPPGRGRGGEVRRTETVRGCFPHDLSRRSTARRS